MDIQYYLHRLFELKSLLDHLQQDNTVFTATAEAVVIFNPKGKVIRANPAAEELFGLDPVGLDQQELTKIVSMRNPDGSPVEVEQLPSEQAIHGAVVNKQRLLLIDHKGLERIIHISASPVKIEAEISSVVTIWQDDTERERLLEQIEFEQSRLEAIIVNTPEAILVTDEEGRLVLGNPAAERVFGRSIPNNLELEELAGLQIKDMDGIPYDPRYLPLTCSALDGELLNNIEMFVEFPDGQIRNLLASTAPIVDRNGNLNGAVGVFQDITDRKQAEEALRQQASRSQLLAGLSKAFAEAGLNSHDLLETTVNQIGAVLGDFCCLCLSSDDGKWNYPAAVYVRDAPLRADYQSVFEASPEEAWNELIARDLQIGRPVIYTDIPAKRTKELLSRLRIPIPDPLVPEWLNGIGIPLRTHGRWFGVLYILRFQQGKHYKEEDQTFLQDLADRAALAIEDSQLFERETQRARELQALHQATTALLSTIDLETLLGQIIDAARHAIPSAEQGMLYLLSSRDKADNNHLVVRSAFGCQNLGDSESDLQQLAARTVIEKRPLLLNHRFFTRLDPYNKTGSLHSVVTAPLMLPQVSGEKPQVLGALLLLGPEPNLFTHNELRLLNSFAATATAALQNATLYAEVQRLATTDTLTEQFNRRRFFEIGELEMHRFRRFQNPLSAIMLDLDNFKEINDHYGHAVGDQVLYTIAQRCRVSIRQVDILGRYGGDEFAILLPSAELEEAFEIAERVRQAVTQSAVSTQFGNVSLSISLGVAQASPNMASLSTLLARADAALYQAKKNGRNQVVQDC